MAWRGLEASGPFIQVPGPPKVPEILAQDPKTRSKSIGSAGSFVVGILEVQVE